MALNFTHLAAFRAAIDAGSIGGGADALLVSQPAVSKQIKLLERAVGVRLLERMSKGVRGTDAGELLATYARQIFALADEAEQAIADLQGLRRGKLVIGASATLAVYFLPELLVRFRKEFPKVSLGLEVENAAVLQRRLVDGDIELGFSEVLPAGDAIESRVFMRERLVAVASPGIPLAKKRRVSVKELCKQPFVVRETGSTTKSMVEHALAGRGLTVEPALAVGSTEAIKRAVAAGMGVAIISGLAAGPEIAAGRLVELRVKDLSLSRPLHELWLRRRRQSAAATAFLKLVHAVAKDG